MRETTGTTWTLQIIILFILIFAAFLTLVLNYFKAYSIKNEMMSVIEKYEGVTDTSVGIMNNILKSKGYKTKGKCTRNSTEEWMGATDLDGNYTKVVAGENYYYCFQKASNNGNESIYYNIKLFYKFNLPVIGEVTTFTINGRTNSFVGSDDI